MQRDGTPLEASAAVTKTPPWHTGLTRRHWRVLGGSYLGWVFDGYEVFALIAALPFALRSLLSPEQAQSTAVYAGVAIGITLLGWGVGGLTGGVLADYLGRKRVMLLSVFFYALFSGVTAFSNGFVMLVVFRFLTGFALGSEWSTGIALVAETWPDRARPKGLGFLQSAFGVGAFIAAAIWYVLSTINPWGEETWRLMFLVGALPAFCVLYLRRALDESERWLSAIRQKRWEAVEDEKRQDSLTDYGRDKRPFTLTTLFRSAEARRRVKLAFLLSLATTTGWWAVSSWLPSYTEELARAQGEQAGIWSSRVALIYTAGGVLAYMASGFIADAIGRRKFLFITYVGCLASTWLTYMIPWDLRLFMLVAFVNGMFTLGFAYAWMAIYPVELFTASVRSSAASVVFNGARLIAWVFPIIAGTLVANFGGVAEAALIISTIYVIGFVVPWFLPETTGKPLPH
jgi:MFS family permease